MNRRDVVTRAISGWMCRGLAAAVAFLPVNADAAAAQQVRESDRSLTEVVPGLYVISDSIANNVVRIRRRDSFIVGPQYPTIVAKVRQLIMERNGPPARFVLISDAPGAARYGDGGWSDLGAVTVAHENLRNRMRLLRPSVAPDSAALTNPMPLVGFSEVFQLGPVNEETHAVHQTPGYGRADVIVHFEEDDVIYLGSIFTNGRYPAFDLENGGSISGMIETVEFFLKHFGSNPNIWYIPNVGRAANTERLREYHRMLTTVRDRIQQLYDAGKSEREVIQSKPTTEFDAVWGHGLVAPAEFVSMAYQSLSVADR